MRKLFLESVKDKSIQRRFKEILEKPLKRKFIQFCFSKYEKINQFGITICFEKPDKELIEFGIEYECYHAHIWIDFYCYCVEVTFMDYN